MPVSLRESQDIDELAGVLYDMLPGSGNPRLSFPTAAQQLGLAAYWTGGSKRPAIVTLLSATYERERHRFCDLIEGIVRQSLSWRAGKGHPLTRDEIDDINRILGRLGYKVPTLHDRDFLASLERRKKQSEGEQPKDPAQLARLKSELLALNSLDPGPRGFAFEDFLNELFAFHNLAPRGSFRLRGEQIDGSFQHDGHTYLFEAKWQNAQVARAELAILNETVTSKARWSRGLIVSYSGFSPDGLEAFERGRPVALIAMDGSDLHEILDRGLPLTEILRAKARRAAESNRCFVPVRFLSPENLPTMSVTTARPDQVRGACHRFRRAVGHAMQMNGLCQHGGDGDPQQHPRGRGARHSCKNAGLKLVGVAQGRFTFPW